MKSKKILLFLVMLVAFIGIIAIGTNVKAFTVCDDGEYVLILEAMDGDVDGELAKVIKFNVDEGETSVKVSELTKGVVAFNGQNEFSHWGKEIFKDTKVEDELKISDFSSKGDIDGIAYTNGLTLWAKFSDKILKGSGTYYLNIDAFAGKVNGEDTLRLTSKSSEFKTVDLSKYTPIRNGYTFVGWDYDGKFVTSIDSKYFKERDIITVTAVYKRDKFEDDGSYVLNLNANGGKIDGKDSNLYNYIGGRDSGTYMPIFQYVPVREGYTFKGWSNKKDGSGKYYKYMYWGSWRNDGTSEFERETLNEEKSLYKTLTLYAVWTKNQDSNTVTKIDSSTEAKGNITFENGVDKNYKLDIKTVEIAKNLTNKNVKYVVDINILDANNSKVSIKDTAMTVKIALPSDLKGYDKYEVVYIKDGKIQETISAKAEGDYLTFKTNHLSEYGVIATRLKDETPKTGVESNMSVFAISLACVAIISTAAVILKKK